jgi:putative spermidine/putrescine transport system permease protein
MRSERYGWRFILVLVLAWTVLLYLFLPIFIAAPISLNPDRYLLMPRGEFSLRHYETLFTSPKWLSSIWQSIVIAVSATFIAVITGSLAAVGIWRLASRLGETMRAFILLPMIVPSIVSGLVFFRIFVDLGLLDSLPGVILAHAVLAAPYVVITVSTSLAGFDLKLEQASRNLGASMRQTIRYVILPNIMPGVLSGAVFAFILSWDEIVVTLFISKLNVFTVPRRMWDGVREQADPTIAACATTLILITFATILMYLIFQRMNARKVKSASPA